MSACGSSRGGDVVETALTPITGFAEAVAAQQTSLFESAVRVAYEAGATRGTLLMAVDVARRLADVPVPVAAQAYATVHRWAWIAEQRGEARRQLVP